MGLFRPIDVVSDESDQDDQNKNDESQSVLTLGPEALDDYLFNDGHEGFDVTATKTHGCDAGDKMDGAEGDSTDESQSADQPPVHDLTTETSIQPPTETPAVQAPTLQSDTERSPYLR